MSSTGALLTDDSGSVQIFDTRVEKSADNSTGQIDYGGLDLPWVATTDKPFPVERLQPVAINVTLVLRADCYHAQATLDLVNKSYQTNVPGLIVTLD